jgi:hypothetical protein
MSDTVVEPAETGAEETVEEQPRGMSERAAKAVLALVALGVAWGVLVAAPWLAYVVIGVMLTLGWQKAHAWRAHRGEAEDQEEAEAEPPDVGAALRRLVDDDKGVLLTVLRDDLKLPDTKAVKALLEAAGIPFKPVNTRKGNGPAVHRDAIPAAPSPDVADSHGEGCCCRSGDNGKGNNSREEGVRVEKFGPGGYIIRDPKDSVRHHRVT